MSDRVAFYYVIIVINGIFSKWGNELKRPFCCKTHLMHLITFYFGHGTKTITGSMKKYKEYFRNFNFNFFSKMYKKFGNTARVRFTGGQYFCTFFTKILYLDFCTR